MIWGERRRRQPPHAEIAPPLAPISGDPRRSSHVALTVFYNGASPGLPRFDRARYQAASAGRSRLIAWCDTAAAPWALKRWHVEPEAVVLRLHIVDADGRLLVGAAAFARLWRELPGYRWAGLLIGRTGRYADRRADLRRFRAAAAATPPAGRAGARSLGPALRTELARRRTRERRRSMTIAAASGAPDSRSNFGVHRVVADAADPRSGRVQWSPVKSLWLTGMTAAALVGGALTLSWDALAVFWSPAASDHAVWRPFTRHAPPPHPQQLRVPALAGICPRLSRRPRRHGWPYGMIRTHDMRDWAQRNPRCHDYFAHRRPFLQDGWWQLHCELNLDRPPAFKLEDRIANDRIYRFMESTLMWQQLPGHCCSSPSAAGAGCSGACARVAVCVTGHWLVGYFAHNSGPRDWACRGRRRAGLQRALLRPPHYGRGLALTTTTPSPAPLASALRRARSIQAGGC